MVSLSRIQIVTNSLGRNVNTINRKYLTRLQSDCVVKKIEFIADVVESTSDPNLTVSMITEELPALTVTTIVGMTVVMLIAILAVFLLGVLIDCRQQRLLEKKMGEAKRMKASRRVNTTPEEDDASIANNMEESGMSEPPAEVLRHIP
ncbi:uncharacterized protein LOC111351636 [Spodoptera litura]|uniref:Uncharacterized protein LOC111351636 n=1 Tax=Spodoptera litura TaxID=69820 RepID=A0A9J7IQC5_SPOLT|nr:uncharacterized protein LOC111351636 [Spodoptera litura]